MATLSDELADALTKTLRLAQLDIQNLDKLFNGNGDVTIARADGSTFAAATWAKMMAATVGTFKQNGNLGTRRLNDVDGRNEGWWLQNSNGNATAARDYPVNQAGSLLITQNGANGAAGCTQEYFVYNSNETYLRTGIANASGITSWTGWQKLAFTSDPEFTGKVVFPAGFYLRKDQVGIKSNSNNDIIFTVKGDGATALMDDKGLYVPGRIDAQGGYQCRMGIGTEATSNKYCMGWDGRMALFVDNTNVGYLQIDPVSDRELKFNIRYTSDAEKLTGLPPDVEALKEVMRWRPAYFQFKPRGELLPESREMLGFIANDLKEASPVCVEGEGLKEGDELDPLKAYRLDQTAMMAKMTLAMQAMEDQIIDLQNTVNDLKAKLVSQ